MKHVYYEAVIHMGHCKEKRNLTSTRVLFVVFGLIYIGIPYPAIVIKSSITSHNLNILPTWHHQKNIRYSTVILHHIQVLGDCLNWKLYVSHLWTELLNALISQSTSFRQVSSSVISMCTSICMHTLSFSQLALLHYTPNLLLFVLYVQILPSSLILKFVAGHKADNPHAKVCTACFKL